MNYDYQQRFGGLARLYGTAALPRLQAAHVAVVGVGGVGSWVVEGLVRSGIGAITMIDLDDVCVTNVNRQLPALDGNIGQPKVAALAERVKLINPACRVTCVSDYFTQETAARLLETKYDWVVDCIDLMSNKALLIAECTKRGIKVVTVGSGGRTARRHEDRGDGFRRRARRRAAAAGEKKTAARLRFREGRGQQLRHPVRIDPGAAGVPLGRWDVRQ